MATKRSGGSAKNLTDSQAKYLGTKLYAGEVAKAGSIIVRQRGTKILAGANVAVGRDHSLYALKDGVVEFTEKNKQNFDGSKTRRKVANIK